MGGERGITSYYTDSDECVRVNQLLKLNYKAPYGVYNTTLKKENYIFIISVIVNDIKIDFPHVYGIYMLYAGLCVSRCKLIL